MKCQHCGKESKAPFCEECFLMELKIRKPHIKFLRKDGTETQNPMECYKIQGIKLKKES